MCVPQAVCPEGHPRYAEEDALVGKLFGGALGQARGTCIGLICCNLHRKSHCKQLYACRMLRQLRNLCAPRITCITFPSLHFAHQIAFATAKLRTPVLGRPMCAVEDQLPHCNTQQHLEHLDISPSSRTLLASPPQVLTALDDIIQDMKKLIKT